MLSQRILDKDGGIGFGLAAATNAYGRGERLNGQRGGAVACGVGQPVSTLCPCKCCRYEEGA
jgi:hypothetical protein